MTTPPTFNNLQDRNHFGNFLNGNLKIIRFAFDDEGNNGFALLNDKRIISWSLSGESEFDTFRQLTRT